MSAKNYVPSGCQLLCDKGILPTPLMVTSNKSKIYGEPIATEADLKLGENIQPFGACSLKNGAPCSFTPLYWDKCINGVKINGKKVIIQEAKLWCAQGGQIAIFLSKADAMATASKQAASKKATAKISEASGPNGAPVIGAGMGVELGTRHIDGFSALSNTTSGVDPAVLPNTTQQGNFGELRTQLDLRSKGYLVTSNRQATNVEGGGHRGLDLAAKDPHGPNDFLVESKYKSTDGPPRMGKAPRSGGRQMGDRWLLNQNRTHMEEELSDQ